MHDDTPHREASTSQLRLWHSTITWKIVLHFNLAIVSTLVGSQADVEKWSLAKFIYSRKPLLQIMILLCQAPEILVFVFSSAKSNGLVSLSLYFLS